jgi:lysophospholipase L1-like esterase
MDVKGESKTIPATARAAGRFYMLGTKVAGAPVEFMHRIGVGPARYVALGDSYSAGEGVPTFEPGTASDVTGDKTANKCHRSLGSYSRLLVDDTTVNANLLPVTYAACSGAVAADVTDPNGRNANEDPQDSHVNQFSDVITLSMGGNDIGFKDIGIACVMPMIECNAPTMDVLGGAAWLANLSKLWTAKFPLSIAIKTVVEVLDKGLSCSVLPADVLQILCEEGKDRAIGTDGGHPGRVASPLNLSDGVLVDRLVQVYTDLAHKAPNAHIYVQPYPQVADNSGAKPKDDCGLLGPGIPALSSGDRDGVSAIISMLNQRIQDAISKANAQLGRDQIDRVDASMGEFSKGQLCTGGILNPGTMFNSIVNDLWGPSDNMGPIAYSFHPNKFGQAAYERGLVQTLNDGIANHVVTVQPRTSADAGTIFVPRGARTVTATSAWPGSTVTMTLISPSGKRYDASTAGVTATSTPTSETLEVAAPEQGTWHVQLYGDDVAAGGEPTQVSATADVPAVGPPSVSAQATPVAGAANTYDLTAVGPADATYRWTLSDGTELGGALVRHAFPADGPRWATVVTTGADGQTTFTPVAIRAADTTPPTLVGMPADVTREATGSTGATVTWVAPTATDDVDDTVTPSCAPASGGTFHLGTTTVTCTATDLSGNTETAQFAVRVVDTTAPKLTGIPADRTVASGTPTTFATPTATDLVDGTVPVTCSPASGTTFPVGATKVTCTATDAAHNAATATFVVTVTPAAGGSGGGGGTGTTGDGGSGGGSGGGGSDGSGSGSGSGSSGGSGGSGSTGGSGGVTGQGGTAITGITLVTPTAPVSPKGVVTVQLDCAKSGGCKGKVKLVVVVNGKTIVLATGKYSAKGKGKATKLKLHLTAAGKAKLKKAHGALKATLQVTASGTKTPSSLPVTLKR